MNLSAHNDVLSIRNGHLFIEDCDTVELATRFGISAIPTLLLFKNGEVVERLLPPIAGEDLGGVEVLLEEAVVMGHLQVIQHVDDHVQVGDEHRLGDIAGKLLVAVAKARPKAGDCFLESLDVELGQVGPGLEVFVELIGLQLTDGDRLHGLPEPFFAKRLKNVSQFHKECGTGAWRSSAPMRVVWLKPSG